MKENEKTNWIRLYRNANSITSMIMTFSPKCLNKREQSES